MTYGASRRRRFTLWIAVAVLAIGAALISWRWLGTSPPFAVDTVSLDCPSDLRDFVACVRGHMPRRNSSRAIVAPDAQALAELAAAAAVLARQAGAGCRIALPEALGRRYRSRELTFADKRYCALWEAHPAEASAAPLGWGTLVVSRAPKRALIMGAPHPLFDMGTLAQSLELFVELDGLAFVMAGSHRHAARLPAGCQWYAPTDASHNLSGYFALASGVADSTSVDGRASWFLEWHGMGAARPTELCYDLARNRPLDVYITEGSVRPLTEGGFAARLATSLHGRQPDLRVASPGDGIDCDKNGATNVLGQFLNTGVGPRQRIQECVAPLPVQNRVTGRFVHIEQLRCARGLDAGSSGVVGCGAAERIRSADRWAQSVLDAYAAAVGEGAGHHDAY